MKTFTPTTLFAITLVLIFTIGPAAAGVFDQLNNVVDPKFYSRESGKLKDYMSSDQYSLLDSRIAKPNTSRFSDQTSKSDLIQIDVPVKDLWKEIPTTGPYCPTCGFKNATYSFGSMFQEDYTSMKSGFFFGGGGGGAGAGGGGCCG